jgi:hypothetical protein
MPVENSTVIGWREWVALPEWGVEYIKVKVDTGARTSSLHASYLAFFEKDNMRWVRFVINPWQDSRDNAVTVEAPVLSMRNVRSSSGVSEQRPVVLAAIDVAGTTITAELTLTNRDKMGFRMLLGREAIRGRFIVNPGRSYFGGRPEKEIRRKNRGRD